MHPKVLAFLFVWMHSTLSLLTAGQNTVNVATAAGRTCTMSTTYNNDDLPCSAANGNTSGEYLNGDYPDSNCIHTSDAGAGNPSVTADREPWFEVDLGRMSFVSSVKVWGRSGFERRLYPFNITVDDVYCGEASPNPVTREHTVTCGSGLWGRKVRLTRGRKDGDDFSLNLCEMEVHNGEPYVTLLCQRDELHGDSWSRFQPNQGCNFTDVVTSNITDSLRNISLSEISMEMVADVINRTHIVLSNCEDCVELDISYVADIMQRTARLDNISQETGQKVLELVDTITEVNSTILRGSNTIGNATNRIITAIEDIGGRIVFDNDTNEVLLVSKKTAVGVWDLSEMTDNLTVGMELLQGGQSLPTLARDDLEPLSEDASPTYNRTDAAIFLRGRFIRNITDNDPGKDVRLTIVVFHDTALFRHGRLETSRDLNRNSKTVLNSKVISAKITVDGVKVTALGDDVVTTVYSLINVPDESRGEKSLCVFWDPAGSKGAGAWSQDGCTHTSTLQDRDVCVCSHLTNFAILLDLYGQDALVDAVHQTALSVITIIGLSLSIAGLSVTVLCFLLIKKLRQGRTQQTQFHMAVSMLGSWVVFLAGFRQDESGASCIAVAAMLHYLILVSFMWMLMEGLLQYLLFVKVLGVGFENYILKTAVVAWSLPLIPVVTILAIDTDLYHGGDQYCWMSLTPFYFAFLAPVALIMLINIVFYVLVICNICRRRNIGSSGTTDSAVGIRASIICFIALGLSWTFAFFAIGDARLVFQYLFTLTSTLQGFLVFLAFTARDPSVRDFWKRLCCRCGQEAKDTELTKVSREPDQGGER